MMYADGQISKFTTRDRYYNDRSPEIDNIHNGTCRGYTQSVLFRVFAECDALASGVHHLLAVKTNRGRKVLL